MEKQTIFEGREIRLYKTAEAIDLCWKKNPKKGDIGGIMESIALHGFLNIPIFSPSLTNVRDGQGAILAGNHRVLALHALWGADDSYWEEIGRERWCPTVEEDGFWLCPVLIVPHLDTETAAIAAALDDNNTALGGDFSASDRMRLWEPKAYIDLLEQVLLSGENAIASEDQDNLAFYIRCAEAPPPEEEAVEEVEKEYQPRTCPHCGGEI